MRFLCSGRSKVQIYGRLNRTQSCQRCYIFSKGQSCAERTQRQAPQTRYTLGHNTASIKKDLIKLGYADYSKI